MSIKSRGKYKERSQSLPQIIDSVGLSHMLHMSACTTHIQTEGLTSKPNHASKSSAVQADMSKAWYFHLIGQTIYVRLSNMISL
jgi:hypothetical protein